MNENVATPLPVQLIPVDTVQIGDVMLMRGRGQLSSLIAWFGDSIYSHASMVAAAGKLIEAAHAGVVEVPLQARLAATDKVWLVDAYRPLANDRSPLSEGDREQVLDHGLSMLGRPFAMNELVTIGVIVALRDKTFPRAPQWLRWLVREAFDHALANDPSQMVCSEFIYRCFAENAAVPTGRLAPEIVVTEPADLPFPAIDVPALMSEVWPLLRPQRKARLERSPVGLLRGDIEHALEDVGEDELAAAARAVRGHLGVAEPEVGLLKAATAGRVVPSVNPKLVRPRDLEETPCHQPLGRLMQAPDWPG
jgi:hypothetical protein